MERIIESLSAAIDALAAWLQKILKAVQGLDYDKIADALEQAEKRAREDAAQQKTLAEIWGGDEGTADELDAYAEECAQKAEELLQAAEEIRAAAQAVKHMRQLVNR